jgi:hypothetical protein
MKRKVVMKIISIQVKPNAKQQRIEIGADGVWQIRLKSPPVEGKANAELIKILAKEFKVPKSAIRIKTGQSSRYKVVEIEGVV